MAHKVMDEKKCTWCGQTKPIKNFQLYKTGKNNGCHSSWCYACVNKQKKIKSPWLKTHKNILYRVTNSESYLKRGIKNFLKIKDLREMWFRDKAYEMTRPSIDRIDGNGHYSVENCRYIELIENLRRTKAKNLLETNGK
jgi:hypothetical protein